MFLAFIALSIIGVVFFFTILLFWSRRLPEVSIPSESPTSEEKRHDETGKDGVVPVLHAEEHVPGLTKGELIHYLGEGRLYAFDTDSSVGELELTEKDLKGVMEGALALTSKAIIVYEGESKKKFYISSIEDYRFYRSYLMIKRKNVKKKKDIIEISPRPVEFRYILHTLTG